ERFVRPRCLYRGASCAVGYVPPNWPHRVRSGPASAIERAQRRLVNGMSLNSTWTRQMTTEAEIRPEGPEVFLRLPWAIAAGALVVFLFTLNHWVSLSSVGVVARLSGWLWQPELNAPLYWLLTAPLRWLPTRAIPLVLNLFSAICAALTLALLAHSVSLLPQDRTEAQRLREKSPSALLSIPAAWLPPLVACLVCGLQLTFWEN